MSIDKTINTNRKAQNAMQRLEVLENALQGLMNFVDKEFMSALNQLNATSEVLNAVTQVIGLDEVKGQLETNAKNKLAAETALLASKVESGELVVAEKVGPASIIGYTEFDENGAVRTPGKFYKNMGDLIPSAQQLLVGQGVGFKTPLGNGSSLEITDIYDVAPPKDTSVDFTAEQLDGSAVVEAPVAEAAPSTEAPQA
jgi:hypothetical protein